ncbi:diguanylate cyclase [Ensifer soli]|uniref:diguanylate cyclase n=1 Tax=Ciceribacter sp. sgz301302 TaxID=3342379 RepID=UPI0035B7117C
MTSVWQVLAGNFAAVALIVLVWMHLAYRFHRLPARTQAVCQGLALGLAAIASMLLSVRLEPGVYFDLRLALVAIAEVFGGPLALAVTTAITAAFRLAIGGAGAFPAVIGMAATAGAGTLVWHLAGRRPVEQPLAIIAVATGFAALSLALVSLLSPTHLGGAVGEIVTPIVLLNFLAVATAGVVITHFRRFTLERDILYAALTQTPDYHYIKDAGHRFVMTNVNVAKHHGREGAADMVGLTDFDLTAPQRAAALWSAEQQVMDTGAPIHRFEECLADGGASPRWYSTSKVALRDRHGDLIGLAGVSIDITERKALEEELRKSRNVMARAMAEMSDGLAMFDATGHVVFCNEQYRALFPRSAHARRKGAHITEIVRAVVRSGERKDVPADLDDAAIEAAARTLHANKDEVIPLSDGRWLSLRTRVAEDGTALALVTDITAMKEAELSLQQFADRMRDLAQTDGLTRLANRRWFDQVLAGETARAARTGLPLALLLVDVDRFKAFNDGYGHLAGDDCLRQVAGGIGAAARRTNDLAARFGGEEFAILLPATGEEDALAVAERLRESIRGLAIAHAGSEFGVVTVSLGVAVLCAAIETAPPEELIRRADAALYRSKSTGRDRVTLFPFEEERAGTGSIALD